jgi:RNA polymerase sigma-70 factor (ECF subfamily)
VDIDWIVGTVTDESLWRQTLAGSADAFGVLFDRHARAVYNFCFRRTASWSQAEDLTSEVFLVAWRRRGEVVFSAESRSLLPWLLGVALHLARNRWRADRRARRALTRLDASAHEADFSDEVIARIADERQMAALLSVLGRLPRHERDVIALCAWADLSYDDCALALGVPVGTVRSRLSRARTHLRKLLAEDAPAAAGEKLAQGWSS